MAARTAVIERKTAETEISVAINLDCQPGSGNKQEISVSTGIGFLDHVRRADLLVYPRSWMSADQAFVVCRCSMRSRSTRACRSR